MCHLVHSKNGDYVRLCYRYGDLRGTRIYAKDHDLSKYHGGCWLRKFAFKTQRIKNGFDELRRVADKTHRCINCGGRLQKSDRHLCVVCMKKKGIL